MIWKGVMQTVCRTCFEDRPYKIAEASWPNTAGGCWTMVRDEVVVLGSLTQQARRTLSTKK